MSPIKFHPQSKFLPVIKLEFLQKPGGLARFPYSVLLALCSPYSIDTTLNKTVPSHAKSEKKKQKQASWKATVGKSIVGPVEHVAWAAKVASGTLVTKTVD